MEILPFAKTQINLKDFVLIEISQERMVDNDLIHMMNLKCGTHTKMKQNSGSWGLGFGEKVRCWGKGHRFQFDKRNKFRSTEHHGSNR